MATVICPNDGWVFKYLDYEGRDPVIEKDADENETVLASLDDTGESFVFKSDKVDADYEAYVYLVDEDGISLTTENKLIQSIKLTSPPSFFDTFEIYMEDCNGVSATYGLKDVAIGKENIIDLSALVRGEDFNDAYVVRIGYHFKGAKSERGFKLIINSLELSFMLSPQYCDPQEVIDFLNITDNRGQPLKLSETSNPSYNTIAKRVIEAEDFVEATTRQSFVERRVENEIRNADSAWPSAYGYYGIYTTSGYDMGAQALFKGCPVKLTHDHIQPIDYSKGDMVEIRRYGSLWTPVGENMIWSDETKGIIYVKSLFFQRDSSVRVTYRYGRGPIPPDLKQAVILKTAILYLQTDLYRASLPQSPELLTLRDTALNSWTWALRDLLRPYTSVVCVGGV